MTTRKGSTVSLERMVLEHPLYLALQRDEPRDGVPDEYVRNFGCHVSPSMRSPLVIHGKECGGPEFFKQLYALGETERKAYFVRHCNVEVFKKIKAALPHEQQESRKRTTRAELQRTYGQTAWSMFKHVGDPYQQAFKYAEENAAELFAEHSDPILLTLALQEQNPLKLFMAQASTVCPFDDVIYGNEEKDKKVNSGMIEYGVGRIYVSTGRHYPLHASRAQLQNLLAGDHDYTDHPASVISHEVGHLATEYFQGDYAFKREREAKHLLNEDLDKVVHKFQAALQHLDSMPNSRSASLATATTKRLLRARGIEPASIKVQNAKEILTNDLNSIACIIAPCADVRKFSVGMYLNEKTLESIEETYEFYTRAERSTEVHARMHELCTTLPRRYVTRLFPKTMKNMHEDAHDLYKLNQHNLNHVDRLKQGKPVLVYEPGNITPKGNSR